MNNCSPLLISFLDEIKQAGRTGPILDLACGAGRNGLFLTENNIPVVFADVNPSALAQVRGKLSPAVLRGEEKLADLWTVDFERGNYDGLKAQQFGGILVFRYLHRPLMNKIKEAIKPGGLIVYETFTVDQPRYGRPTNPDYLLNHGELAGYFHDWSILYSFEGILESKPNCKLGAIAQIVAKKTE